ncbi:hypothetical protein MWU75_04450 [Ornithinimicrobium sp. F0845]|uniref:DUF6912 family protein n=1 Tax=Ornithinimicrobium sp. F0845 TaxID=2926412 RepID=UPI001FF5377A|nr:hypothetical protein [Ornithinimicrobium sp. F0845]MCK0111385.1 hypothetical protein [Ornithinimicrobium sp. F0845]
MAPIPPQVRCYLPLTADLAQTLHETGSMPGDLVAFVVTESVRRSDPSGDEESWEYAALQDAAAYCLQEGQPVLVAAADVARDTIDDSGPTGSRVLLRGSVTLPRIASLHAGDDLVGEVSSVSDDEHVIELSWYDATELADVRALL